MIGVIHCRCLTSRELLKHHQKCTASDCPVCTPVKQYVQKQRMAMQKQQQESLRQREAERQRYGESRMQVLLFCLPSCNSSYSLHCSPLPHAVHLPFVPTIGRLTVQISVLLLCSQFSSRVVAVVPSLFNSVASSFGSEKGRARNMLSVPLHSAAKRDGWRHVWRAAEWAASRGAASQAAQAIPGAGSHEGQSWHQSGGGHGRRGDPVPPGEPAGGRLAPALCLHFVGSASTCIRSLCSQRSARRASNLSAYAPNVWHLRALQV